MASLICAGLIVIIILGITVKCACERVRVSFHIDSLPATFAENEPAAEVYPSRVASGGKFVFGHSQDAIRGVKLVCLIKI